MNRFTNDIPANLDILGSRLTFNSGKIAANRFLKAALTERLSSYEPSNPTSHGIPSDKLINLYEKWGNGQYGMILTGNVIVDRTNLEFAKNAIIFKEGECEKRREMFKKWAKVTKQDDALAIVQLSHAGRQTPIAVERNPYSASDVQLVTDTPTPAYGKPRALTIQQIKSEVIDRFAYAAKFAYETGFDGVQLHAAHGYLLSQFTSPTTNKRNDHYGGSLENRIRIILEIYDAIRAQVPKDFIVGIKSNSVEFQSGGLTVEDAKEICRKYEKKGFDFVELSGGTYEKLAFHHTRESTKRREAFFLEFAETIRPVFKNTIVYLTGGFRSANAMVEAIESDATQGIGLGRPITSEPDLPKKILSRQVASAPISLLDQSDTWLTVLGSVSQMEQMSRKSLKEADNNVMSEISDFSDPSTIERYLEAVKKFREKGTPSNDMLLFD